MSDSIDNFLSETLKKTQDTKYLKCLKIFGHNEELKDLFRYNVMCDRIEYTKNPPWNKDAKNGDFIEDFDLIGLKSYLSRNYSFTPSKEDIQDAIEDISRRMKYDPVKDYLSSLRWDGASRLDKWLVSVCGAEDNRYVNAVGRKVLVGAVKRIFEPGCQFDYMMVLEGKQGIRKTSMVQTLVGNIKYYGSVNFHLGDKEFIENMMGKWILEVEEMSGQKKQEVERVKKLISKRIDTARLAWGRVVKDFKRKTILIGTYNPVEGDNTWLHDPTGNRRFWPIECGENINIDLLKENRDQLFAEAVHLYKNNEPLYLDDKEIELMAVAEQEKRQSEDPWVELINNWLEDQVRKGVDYVTVLQVALECISISKERINRATNSRIGRIMTKTKWQKTKEVGFNRRQFYAPPGANVFDEKYRTLEIEWDADVKA